MGQNLGTQLAFLSAVYFTANCLEIHAAENLLEKAPSGRRKMCDILQALMTARAPASNPVNFIQNLMQAELGAKQGKGGTT